MNCSTARKLFTDSRCNTDLERHLEKCRGCRDFVTRMEAVRDGLRRHHAGATPDPDEIRAFLRARLAVYKVPRRVLFFTADEIAYTGNQKVQLEPLTQAAQRRLEAEGAEIEGYRYG